MGKGVGFRVYKNINRPAKESVERFRGIPTSNINDMMNRLYNTNGTIKPMNNVPMCGVAITVKAPLGDNMMFHRALDIAQPGDVVVVDGGGCINRSLAGEIMMTYAAKKGIAGIVVDGALRDGNGLRDCPMPIYCKALTPQGPYKNGPGEINVPVCIGGVAVMPGDIVVGDEDGVVFIRPDDADYVYEKVVKKVETETKKLEMYRTVGIDEDKHCPNYIKQVAEAGGIEFE